MKSSYALIAMVCALVQLEGLPPTPPNDQDKQFSYNLCHHNHATDCTAWGLDETAPWTHIRLTSPLESLEIDLPFEFEVKKGDEDDDSQDIIQIHSPPQHVRANHLHPCYYLYAGPVEDDDCHILANIEQDPEQWLMKRYVWETPNEYTEAISPPLFFTYYAEGDRQIVEWVHFAFGQCQHVKIIVTPTRTYHLVHSHAQFPDVDGVRFFESFRFTTVDESGFTPLHPSLSSGSGWICTSTSD